MASKEIFGIRRHYWEKENLLELLKKIKIGKTDVHFASISQIQILTNIYSGKKAAKLFPENFLT